MSRKPRTGEAVKGGLQEYTAYIVDQNDDVTTRVDLICDNEESARQLARQLVDGDAVELWQGQHKIERFDPPAQVVTTVSQLPNDIPPLHE